RHTSLFYILLLSSTAPPPPEIYTLSLHDALPISGLAYREEPAARIESERHRARPDRHGERRLGEAIAGRDDALEAEARLEGADRSEEHTSELQSLAYLVCRLLLEKKKKND